MKICISSATGAARGKALISVILLSPSRRRGCLSLACKKEWFIRCSLRGLWEALNPTFKALTKVNSLRSRNVGIGVFPRSKRIATR